MLLSFTGCVTAVAVVDISIGGKEITFDVVCLQLHALLMHNTVNDIAQNKKMLLDFDKSFSEDKTCNQRWSIATHHLRTLDQQ